MLQTAFVGDLLLGIPLLKRLRALEPDANLHLYCRKGLGGFFLDFDLADEITEVDKTDPASFPAAAGRLRAREWDWILSPHESLRTHALVRSLRAKRKTGYKKFWNAFVFNERITRPMALPEALRQLALLQADEAVVRDALKSYPKTPDFKAFPELASLDAPLLGPVPSWASMAVPKLSRIHQGRAHPGTRALLTETPAKIADELKLMNDRGSGVAFLSPGSVWPTKMWTREGYRDCAKELKEKGFRVVLTGAPAERELCAAIAKEAGVESIAGRTSLAQSAQILALADLLICNDSGAMHMAAAATVANVAVFGPTTLALGYRPWQEQARVVQKNLDCRPCGKHGAKACPIGTHECMKAIPASTVMIEAGELLACVVGRGAPQ